MSLGIVASAHVETAPVGGITVVASGTGGEAGGNDPSVTFTGYTPQLNDLVMFFMGSSTFATVVDITGWTNLLGSATALTPSDNTVNGSAAYHWVTSGEVTAGTTTYTMTNWYAGSEGYNVIGIVLRGVSTSTPIDLFATNTSIDPLTTHTFPALEGDNLSTGSLVLRWVEADSAVTYSALAAGHTQVTTTSTSSITALLTRMDTPTTTGVDIPAATVTATPGDEHVSISVALTAA